MHYLCEFEAFVADMSSKWAATPGGAPIEWRRRIAIETAFLASDLWWGIRPDGITFRRLALRRIVSKDRQLKEPSSAAVLTNAYSCRRPQERFAARTQKSTHLRTCWVVLSKTTRKTTDLHQAIIRHIWLSSDLVATSSLNSQARHRLETTRIEAESVEMKRVPIELE